MQPVFRSLLMRRSSVTPEPDIYPYLLTTRTPRNIKLMASEDDALYYTINYPKLIISDNLSNKNIYDKFFDIQFWFTPDTTAAYRKIFEIPNLISISYNWQGGYGLIVDLKQVGQFYITTNYVPTDGCIVQISRQNDPSDIILRIDSTQFVLWDYKHTWTQPVLTSNTSYGTVTSSANRNSTDTQAEWHALDGLLPDPNDQYTYFGWDQGIDKYWQWNIPNTLEITGLSLYNRASTSSTNYSRTIQFYADEEQEIAIGDPVTLLDNYTSESVVTNITPTTTNILRAHLIDTYGGTTAYGGIGELYITANQIETPLQYSCGELQLYDKSCIHSVYLDGYTKPYCNITLIPEKIVVPLGQQVNFTATVDTNVEITDTFFAYDPSDRQIYNGELHWEENGNYVGYFYPQVIGTATSGYMYTTYDGVTYNSNNIFVQVVLPEQVSVQISPETAIIQSGTTTSLNVTISDNCPLSSILDMDLHVEGQPSQFQITRNSDNTITVQHLYGDTSGEVIVYLTYIHDGWWYYSNKVVLEATEDGQEEYCNITVTPSERTVSTNSYADFAVSFDTNITPVPTVSSCQIYASDITGTDDINQFSFYISPDDTTFIVQPKLPGTSISLYLGYGESETGQGSKYLSNSFTTICESSDPGGDNYFTITLDPEEATINIGEYVDLTYTIQTNLEQYPTLYFFSNNWDVISVANGQGNTVRITGLQTGTASFYIGTEDQLIMSNEVRITVTESEEEFIATFDPSYVNMQPSETVVITVNYSDDSQEFCYLHTDETSIGSYIEEEFDDLNRISKITINKPGFELDFSMYVYTDYTEDGTTKILSDTLNVSMKWDIPEPTTDSAGNKVYPYILANPGSGHSSDNKTYEFGTVVWSYVPKSLVNPSEIISASYNNNVLLFATSISNLEKGILENFETDGPGIIFEFMNSSYPRYKLIPYSQNDVFESYAGATRIQGVHYSTDTLVYTYIKNTNKDTSTWGIQNNKLYNKGPIDFIYSDESCTNPVGLLGPYSSFLTNLLTNHDEYDAQLLGYMDTWINASSIPEFTQDKLSGWTGIYKNVSRDGALLPSQYCVIVTDSKYSTSATKYIFGLDPYNSRYRLIYGTMQPLNEAVQAYFGEGVRMIHPVSGVSPMYDTNNKFMGWVIPIEENQFVSTLPDLRFDYLAANPIFSVDVQTGLQTGTDMGTYWSNTLIQ